MAPTKCHPVGFLNLPNELRNRIYAFLFDGNVVRVTATDVTLDSTDGTQGAVEQEDEETLKKTYTCKDEVQNILFTCRRCYTEGVDRYWRNLTLRFESTEQYRSIALSMPDPWYDRFARIRYVEFGTQEEINSPLNFVAFEKLQDIHFLESPKPRDIFVTKEIANLIECADEELINHIMERPSGTRWAAAKRLCPQRQIDIFLSCRLIVRFLRVTPSTYDRFVELPVCVNFTKMQVIDVFKGDEKRHVPWTLAVTSLTEIREDSMTFDRLTKSDEKSIMPGEFHHSVSILEILGIAAPGHSPFE